MAPGNTPLMRAVENGHAGVVALLLDAAKQRQRPIAKRRNMKGETALHKAAATGAYLTPPLHAPAARCAACVSRVSCRVRSSHGSSCKPGNVEVARLLVEQGRGSVDVSAHTHSDHGGDTPLHVAAERGHWSMVGYLLSIRDESAAHDAAAAAAAQAPSSDPTPVAAAASGAPPVVSAGRTSTRANFFVVFALTDGGGW
jgi:ankyrin repeat protein